MGQSKDLRGRSLFRRMNVDHNTIIDNMTCCRVGNPKISLKVGNTNTGHIGEHA